LGGGRSHNDNVTKRLEAKPCLLAAFSSSLSNKKVLLVLSEDLLGKKFGRNFGNKLYPKSFGSVV